MSSNAIGTVIRIFFIFIFLLFCWFVPVVFLYALASYFFALEFSYSVLGVLFVALIFIRMFYPKFVFK